MKTRGFTLIEVMVALFVIALGLGALLTTVANSASAATYLRDKTFAQWIAYNRVAEARLSSTRPQPGLTTATVEYAGREWELEQEVAEAGIGSLMRIDVRVMDPGDDAAKATRAARGEGKGDQEPAVLARAVGFTGTAMARANGLTPEWSFRPRDPNAPGGPGGPGGGGPEGPGGPGGGGSAP